MHDMQTKNEELVASHKEQSDYMETQLVAKDLFYTQQIASLKSNIQFLENGG